MKHPLKFIKNLFKRKVVIEPIQEVEEESIASRLNEAEKNVLIEYAYKRTQELRDKNHVLIGRHKVQSIKNLSDFSLTNQEMTTLWELRPLIRKLLNIYVDRIRYMHGRDFSSSPDVARNKVDAALEIDKFIESFESGLKSKTSENKDQMSEEGEFAFMQAQLDDITSILQEKE